MISLDSKRCTKCGICISLMKNYCISEKDGYPVFDYSVCNICQKCVTVCPSQAIMVNNVHPDKIKKAPNFHHEALISLFENRRSIKDFKDKSVSKEIIRKIVSTAKYAPNQNKNISVLVIDDKKLINEIDKYARLFEMRMYNIFFSFKPVTMFINLFMKNADEIKKKMEYSMFHEKHVVKENTQVLIILTGNKNVPVTQSSAHYMLAAILYTAESLGVNSCLMDSLLLAINTSGKLKKTLNIKDNVLGVLSLGYSNENIVNIPRGYEVDIRWNR